MVAPTATIEVYVDGTRVPSTPGELAAGQVTALDNLRLTWGRDGQNEQPGPASVVLEMVDPAGGADVLDVLHVGSDVAIWAEGQISTGTGFGPNTFDPAQAGQTYPDGPPPALTSATHDGTLTIAGQTIEYTVESDSAWSSPDVIVPPRAWSPAGQLPDAWDSIPRAELGQTWRVSARVKVRAGVRWKLGLYGYTTPYWNGAYSGATSTAPAAAWNTGTGDWQTVTVDYRITSLRGAPAAWLAVYVSYEAKLRQVRWQDQTGTWAGDTRTWDDPSLDPRAWVDEFTVNPPPDTTRRVLVFSGEVSDLAVAPWGDRFSTGITATAVDLGGQLGQTVVGDTPWPVQTVAVRANRVAQLAGVTTTPRVRIDTPLDVLQVSARDVDAQPAYQLLQDLAQSAGGVLWAATHAVTGAFLWIENPANRAAVRQLELTGGLITITAATRGASIVSACDLLEGGVTWAQDSADVVSVVAVTWAEQGPPGDDGQPTVTERTVTVSDPAAVATYGTRRLSISTELIAAADATAYANRVLAQARAVGWRLDGLTLDTGAGLADTLDSVDDVTRQTALLDLLDGTTRMGAAVTLVDMPAYAPRGAVSAVYVDGGTYTYTGDAWALQLATTPSAGQGSSVTWGELDPTWRWDQWSPSLRWVDLYGTAA